MGGMLSLAEEGSGESWSDPENFLRLANESLVALPLLFFLLNAAFALVERLLEAIWWSEGESSSS